MFFSTGPLALEEIADQLAISKASASTGARQLLNWGAIRQVWGPGDRRDFFELADNPSGLLRQAYLQFVKPRLTGSQKRIEAMTAGMQREFAEGLMTPEAYEVCSARLARLREFHDRLQSAAPLIEQFLY